MAFTLRNIKDLEDIGPGFGGAPGLEFRAATRALDSRRRAAVSNWFAAAVSIKTTMFGRTCLMIAATSLLAIILPASMMPTLLQTSASSGRM